FQESFISHAKNALAHIMAQTTYDGIFILGMPLDIFGMLYNCAVVVKEKRILGIVPKHYLPNHHEYYEKRWFHSGYKTMLKSVQLLNQTVPFGYLIFEDEEKNIRFGVEVCQDVWATYSPSDDMSLAGANIIFNLSASTEHVGKRALRKTVVLDHSRKQMTAYVYTTSGHFESSSEVVFSSHKIIAVQGELKAESQSFEMNHSTLVCDLDMTAINYQKRQDSTQRDMHMFIQNDYQYIYFHMEETKGFVFEHKVEPMPFIPKEHLEDEIVLANQVQVYALIKRLESMPQGANKIVLGISGGLDSTLALLVAHQTFKALQRDFRDIIAVTMPSHATSKTTKTNALKLMEFLGVTSLEIPIHDALDGHLKDINHQEKDVTFENAQARIRTLILMDLANKHGGFVLGTGDLSEIALGWMTYNGDQMSMYAINAGLPKTWVKLLVDYHSKHTYQQISDLLQTIHKAPISPELLENQETEKTIGRYDVNDFILYHHLVQGADEAKIIWLIPHAFDLGQVEAKVYVDRFFKRFYSQQFKRQTLPEGPKILGISLSPRGDYRMPSDVKRK
ncbi:MAG: NAD(+) synthase, partial [Acholeplasmataceae bacterium]|nr:NAD(+) synthase [Acholeplasmataceae bacterium]